jgi:hypothetical protein
MTDEPTRRFDEDEVAKILERATELHREEPTAPGRSGGLSLEELEEIAGEAGIDRRHLQRAVMEVSAGRDPGWSSRFLGADPTVALETTVPGEMAEEDFERVIGVIRHHAPEHGQPSLLGRSLTWRSESSDQSRTLQVTVTARDGATRIRVEERLQKLAGGIFGGGLGGFGGGLGFGVGLPVGLEVLGSVAAAVAFPVGVIGLTWLGARAVFRRVVRTRRKAVAALMEGVVQEVQASVRRRERLDAPPGEDRIGPGG